MPSITINTVGTALGQYCVQYGRQFNQDVRQNLELDTMLPRVSCDYAYQGQDIEHSSVLQPYQKAFTPNNSATFDGVLNILQVGKIDLEYDWDEIQVFMDKWRCNWFQAGKAEQEWNFPRFMINEIVMKQFFEDVNIASYSGEYQAPTAGTPGNYLDTFTGFNTYISQFILDGLLVPITVGALTDTTAVDQVKAFCKQLPLLVRYKKGTIYMSKTDAQKYADHYEVKYPNRKVVEEQHDRQYLKVDHFNKKIVGLDCMEGSGRMILILDGLPSLVVGTKTGMSPFPQLRFHVYDRTLHVLGEFWRFYGFETLKHLYVSDIA